ncbi:MAG TPA: cytochrome c, partial [Terracidiphilus sp.]|nr:cytochrome c [Terracidiphilus sp.]
SPAASHEAIVAPAPTGTAQRQDPQRAAVLSRQAALLPPGVGRDITIRACSTCHGLDVITNERLSPREWTNVVQTMSAKGASASAMELESIRAYLAQAFPRTGGKSRK